MFKRTSYTSNSSSKDLGQYWFCHLTKLLTLSFDMYLSSNITMREQPSSVLCMDFSKEHHYAVVPSCTLKIHQSCLSPVVLLLQLVQTFWIHDINGQWIIPFRIPFLIVKALWQVTIRSANFLSSLLHTAHWKHSITQHLSCLLLKVRIKFLSTLLDSQ